MNSADFLDAVGAKYGLDSDNKIAEQVGLNRANVSLWRNGKREFPEHVAIKVAEALELPAGYVLAELRAERAKRTEVKAAWHRVAEIAKRSQAAALLACAVIVGGISTLPDQVGAAAQCILCKFRGVWRQATDCRHQRRRYTDEACWVCLDCGITGVDAWRLWPKSKRTIVTPVRALLRSMGHRARMCWIATKRTVCLATVCVAFTGCAATGQEKAWQALHLVDVAQTLNGPARDACYREATWPTSAVIGEQPSTGSVLAWGAASAGLHYLFDRWLTRSGQQDATWARIVRGIDLTAKAYTVGQNFDYGIRPFGPNDCPHAH